MPVAKSSLKPFGAVSPERWRLHPPPQQGLTFQELLTGKAFALLPNFRLEALRSRAPEQVLKELERQAEFLPAPAERDEPRRFFGGLQDVRSITPLIPQPSSYAVVVDQSFQDDRRFSATESLLKVHACKLERIGPDIAQRLQSHGGVVLDCTGQLASEISGIKIVRARNGQDMQGEAIDFAMTSFLLAESPLALVEHGVSSNTDRSIDTENVGYTEELLFQVSLAQKNRAKELSSGGSRVPFGLYPGCKAHTDALFTPTSGFLQAQYLDDVGPVVLRPGGKLFRAHCGEELFGYLIAQVEEKHFSPRACQLKQAFQRKYPGSEASLGYIDNIQLTDMGAAFGKIHRCSLHEQLLQMFFESASQHGLTHILGEVRVFPYPNDLAFEKHQKRGWERTGMFLLSSYGDIQGDRALCLTELCVLTIR